MQQCGQPSWKLTMTKLEMDLETVRYSTEQTSTIHHWRTQASHTVYSRYFKPTTRTLARTNSTSAWQKVS